jgi:hypothetical protein
MKDKSRIGKIAEEQYNAADLPQSGGTDVTSREVEVTSDGGTPVEIDGL